MVVWLIAWVVLQIRWKWREIESRRVNAVTWILVALSLLLTFARLESFHDVDAAVLASLPRRNAMPPSMRLLWAALLACGPGLKMQWTAGVPRSLLCGWERPREALLLARAGDAHRRESQVVTAEQDRDRRR